MTTGEGMGPIGDATIAERTLSRRRGGVGVLPIAVGAAAVAVGALGLALVVEGALWLPFLSLVPYAVLALWILTSVDAAHPFDRFGPANLVTLARAVLNCWLVGLVVVVWLDSRAATGLGWAILGIALGSLLLDGVDGRLARRAGLASGFGARFDVEVDALLLSVLALALLALGKVGAWIVAMAAAYYLFRVAGALWPWLRAPLPPSRRRKAVFVLQAAALLLALAPVTSPSVSTAVCALALGAMLASFAVDVVWLVDRRHRLASAA